MLTCEECRTKEVEASFTMDRHRHTIAENFRVMQPRLAHTVLHEARVWTVHHCRRRQQNTLMWIWIIPLNEPLMVICTPFSVCPSKRYLHCYPLYRHTSFVLLWVFPQYYIWRAVLSTKLPSSTNMATVEHINWFYSISIIHHGAFHGKHHIGAHMMWWWWDALQNLQYF